MMSFRAARLLAALLPALLALAAACDSPSPAAPTHVDVDAADRVALSGGSTLVFRDGGRLAAHRDDITRLTAEAVDAARRLIPFDGVTIAASADTAFVIAELGFGGFADGGHTVRLSVDPSSSAMPTHLSTDLVPLLSHELHHIARQRTVGYGSTLLEALVSEGLADHFALEVSAAPPAPWTMALSPAALVSWTDTARTVWSNPSYDHAAWFLGAGSIPRWTGYSIGFAMTADYLRAHPSRRASDLHAEPASGFARFAPGS